MRNKWYAALLAATLGCLGWIPVAFSEDAEYVRVVPKETDAILANPGMGWETFHHTAKQDKHLPAWIPSTVHYARWGWGTLEPEKGKINYGFLDDILDETREAGQKLAFRAMCCSSYPGRPYHPDWLRDMGGKVVVTRYGDGPELEVPAFDDPIVLAAHLDFIRRLGARYDGHPDIDHVDLGSVGWWGEWHMSRSTNAPMPTPETQKKIVDAYLAAFQKTPLVMLIGGGEMLKYAVENGAGWRADCLGDLGGFSTTWCHMRMAYPQRLPDAAAMGAWKNAPVAWETCWDMRKWVEQGWSLRFIFNYALALHGSVINNKSAPLPEGEQIRPEVERFLRRLGYRFVLKELEHPKQVQSGDVIKIATQWQNTGSAPCYRPYRLAYRLANNNGDTSTFVSLETVDQWMPGEIEVFNEDFFEQPADLPPGPMNKVVETIPLPKSLPSGAFDLSIAIVGERNSTPIVQLGIAGRDKNGWYPLSRIQVDAEKTDRGTKTAAPDLSVLKAGMTLSHAKELLGSAGRLRENSSFKEALYDFDFDGKSALLIVDRASTPPVVSQVLVSNHGKTVEEIRAERNKKWSEWVEAHSPKKRD